MPFRSFYLSVARLTVVGGATLLVAGCRTSYEDLPTYSEERNLLQVVVETPAGTNHEIRYSARDHDFRRVQQAGSDRVVPFLPYPANVGFIPSTRGSATARRTGTGTLTALVLAESQPSGTIMEVLPVALLMLDNAGEMQTVVVTVPARPSQQVIAASSWHELTTQYPGVREVLHTWYQHHAGRGQVRVVGWRDEHAAERQVREAQRR
ncbi:inorganic diphosphatase [Hymenobacter koreensis]|uniref:inorganic diphosphatase n=1 Tax=Hymenobacter koreensis TaxID=1084523 RepID=A0ABP8IVS7_9BACT